MKQSWKKIGLGFILLVVLVIAWFTPQVHFWYHTMRCGGYPVLASEWGRDYVTKEAGAGYWELTNDPLFYHTYFCNESQAVSKGYHLVNYLYSNVKK